MSDTTRRGRKIYPENSFRAATNPLGLEPKDTREWVQIAAPEEGQTSFDTAPTKLRGRTAAGQATDDEIAARFKPEPEQS